MLTQGLKLPPPPPPLYLPTPLKKTDKGLKNQNIKICLFEKVSKKYETKILPNLNKYPN
jgi:hypothetical protein